MAILLPLLVLLVMGIIDVGRIFFTNITIHEAAQEGAYFGAFFPSVPGDVQQRSATSVDNPALTDANVDVTCPVSGEIQVRVRYQLNLLTPIVGDMLGDPWMLDEDVRAQILSGGSCVPS
jgi:hypothetical protein